MTGFGLARRVLALFAGAVFTAAIALVLGTVVPRPFWPHEVIASGEQHRVLMLMNPIHTDLAISLEPAVRSAFSFAGAAGQPIDAAGARYLVIGWGGRDFYTQTPTWSQVKLLPLLKGLTFDRAVLHVDVAGDIPEPHPEVIAIDLDDAAFDALLTRIVASFVQDGSGPVHLPGVNYGAHDAFYEANGAFTAVLGCNTWTASVLRAAGIRTGWWNPLPQSLGLSIRSFNDLP